MHDQPRRTFNGTCLEVRDEDHALLVEGLNRLGEIDQITVKTSRDPIGEEKARVVLSRTLGESEVTFLRVICPSVRVTKNEYTRFLIMSD